MHCMVEHGNMWLVGYYQPIYPKKQYNSADGIAVPADPLYGFVEISKTTCINLAAEMVNFLNGGTGKREDVTFK